MKKIKITIGLLFIGITFSCSKDPEVNSTDSPDNYHQDKDVEILFENDPENGINVIFMGDAYQRIDLKKVNGKYKQDAIKSIEFLFNSHPFFEYKNHFNAYVVYAESSIQNTGNGFIVNYPFGSSSNISGIFHNPYITNYGAVNDYVFKVKGRPKNDNDLILMAVNGQNGGTATSGSNIAVFGTRDSTTILTTVFGVMLHEVGHAFGSLGDEYNVPNANMTAIIDGRANLDITNNLSLVKWNHFIGLDGYSSVGAYEGGGYQQFGVWRPEANSIMMGNVGNYFNAPSREAIVKKIMNVRGIAYDFNSFLTLDVGNQINRFSKNITNEKFERINCGFGKDRQTAVLPVKPTR